MATKRVVCLSPAGKNTKGYQLPLTLTLVQCSMREAALPSPHSQSGIPARGVTIIRESRPMPMCASAFFHPLVSLLAIVWCIIVFNNL